MKRNAPIMGRRAARKPQALGYFLRFVHLEAIISIGK